MIPPPERIDPQTLPLCECPEFILEGVTDGVECYLQPEHPMHRLEGGAVCIGGATRAWIGAGYAKEKPTR